ncbi:TonB-dependent receptor [Pseudoduganella flava]|uniref:TonB-dependent receptor n=1 Tax=Pseudoduganella flava TaxID=871742 RepID=A0A562PQI5_9BURK|nr:TonB-dependent receptor [Pseudoduganella flava]QGZ37882.1 TonB-dependent receptor [Pseudoduganella flava]TWI46715.1 TonB-dependent receptor [Pseudoduganella flava]
MRHLALPALGLLAATGVHAADQTIVVTGQRVSLARAIAAQEKADNIVSVVSSDDIGGLPDKNAAEALARLPGVAVQRDQGEGRYVTVRGLDADLNAVTINGALVPSPEATRRAVALDVLPAGLIRTLEVTKTLTPDQDANSLGGSVEVKTLSAFDLPGSLLSVGAGASRDTNTDQTSPSANVLWAQRFADGKLGVAAGLSGEKRKFGSDNVETGGAWNGNRLAGFELRDYLPVRERYAAALNLDWRPDAAQSYALRSFVSRFSDDEVRDRLTVSNIKTDDLAEGQTAGARVERRLRQRKYTQEIRSLTASSDVRLDAWRLHAEAAASRATDDTPESINDARFRGSFTGIGFTNTMAPRLIAPAAVFDPANYTLNAITLQQRYSEDRAKHVRLDLGRDIESGDWRTAVKFGAKASRRDKDNDTNQWAYNSSKTSSGNYWGAGPTTLAGFVRGDSLDYALGKIGQAIDPAAVRARIAALPRAGAQLAAESALNDFAMSEDIDAAYVQGTVARGDWSVLAGVRGERTRFDALGAQVNGTAVTPRQASRSYTNWLPTVQARFDLDRSTSVRAAWSNAVVRANFSQLAPGISLASTTEATIGNPDLAPLKSHNLDLGIERVLGNDGTMSAYVFHKDISNFTYATNLAGSGRWAGYTTATSYANGDSAKVKGIELSWQQSLRMLPAPFNGLLVGVNGAFTSSDARIDSFDAAAGKRATRTIRMPGQSNRMANLMVGYEMGPISTRLAVNYKSPYLLELGDDVLDASGDRIVDTQKQVDLSFAWQVAKGWQLTFEAANLNNEKYYVYQGVKAHNVQYEQYGRTYKIGLKASLF